MLKEMENVETVRTTETLLCMLLYTVYGDAPFLGYMKEDRNNDRKLVSVLKYFYQVLVS